MNTSLQHKACKSFAILADDLDFSMAATQEFPWALWQAMANRKLLKNYSSADTTYKEISAGGLALTQLSASPGLTMTWLGQLLKIGLLKRHGKLSQPCINTVLSGESLCALAISEPDAGAHPKHLSSTADQKNGYFVLNGKKAFVSDGPHADWFIIIAITSIIAGRKHYSAFLVHKSQPGLILGRMEHSAKLRPSGHCTITLDNCQVAGSALIGTEGRAFDEISKPLRTLEDILMLAAIAGAMWAQLNLIVRDHRDNLALTTLGHWLSLANSTAELGLLAAGKLDNKAGTEELTTLINGARALIKDFQKHIKPFLRLSPQCKSLYDDIALITSIGQTASQARTSSLASNYLVI
jgi:acyl-CoA dehydrogenase